MSGPDDLRELIADVQGILLPLKASEFSDKINKVSAYTAAIEKSLGTHSSALESIRGQASGDQDEHDKEIAASTAALKASVGSSIRFARMNLDQAMAQALDRVVRRPRSASKVDESKRKQTLGEWFDRLPDPAPAMLDHFMASSNPLDKWLVVGPWGHEYLRRRHINPQEFDGRLCELISCSDSAAVGMVLSYGRLVKAMDALEEMSVGLF